MCNIEDQATVEVKGFGMLATVTVVGESLKW